MKSGFKLGDYVETKTLEELKAGHSLLKLFPPRAPALNIDPDNALPKIFEARTQGLYEPEQMKMMRAYPQNVLNKVLEHDGKSVVEKFIERFEMSGTALTIVIVVFLIVGALILGLILIFFVKPFKAVQYIHNKYDDYDKRRKGEEHEEWEKKKEPSIVSENENYSETSSLNEEPEPQDYQQSGGEYLVEPVQYTPQSSTDYQPLEGGGMNEVLF
jgi:hypothetical protein